MTSYGYTPVPGSDRLKTRPVGAGPAAELEALDPAVASGRMVEGEWLARCVVRDRFVPVLWDVYDRLALDQEAHEQAVYGHLWRLALGEERNWCRVSLKELQQRTKLSERRLNKALAGLVAKGHLRLVERDRRGTLYRVMLPHEVFGEPDGDVVHMPRPRPGTGGGTSAAPAGASGNAPRPAPNVGTARASAATSASESTARGAGGARESSPSGGAAEATGRHGPASARPRSRKIGHDSDTLLDSSSIGALARSFVERFGEGPGRTREDVVEEILGLLEDGVALADAASKLAAFGKAAPRRTPLSELKRFLARTD